MSFYRHGNQPLQHQSKIISIEVITDSQLSQEQQQQPYHHQQQPYHHHQQQQQPYQQPTDMSNNLNHYHHQKQKPLRSTLYNKFIPDNKNSHKHQRNVIDLDDRSFSLDDDNNNNNSLFDRKHGNDDDIENNPLSINHTYHSNNMVGVNTAQFESRNLHQYYIPISESQITSTQRDAISNLLISSGELFDTSTIAPSTLVDHTETNNPDNISNFTNDNNNSFLNWDNYVPNNQKMFDFDNQDDDNTTFLLPPVSGISSSNSFNSHRNSSYTNDLTCPSIPFSQSENFLHALNSKPNAIIDFDEDNNDNDRNDNYNNIGDNERNQNNHSQSYDDKNHFNFKSCSQNLIPAQPISRYSQASRRFASKFTPKLLSQLADYRESAKILWDLDQGQLERLDEIS